jgi:thiol-disulfide isomerase/thioredoxin
MDRIQIQRRKFLTLLGLGVVSASGCSLASGKLNSSQDNSASKDAQVSTPKSIITPSQKPVAALPKDAKLLPEFQGISQWLNSKPLNIADLKGNVVLIQFWTFACINCQRTLPYITRWHRTYESKGLKVVGIHTPEFPYEKQVGNIKQALKKHGITYPVPVDNDYQTWKAYNNEYWPHLFLADKQGVIRYDHIGEGAYENTEKIIQQLLA